MGVNVLSLFDGISCGMIALDRADISVDNYYSSEIEKSAIEISNKNYPEIIRLGDVTKVDVDVLKTLPKIDLILAGSPCTGFSRQGKCLNFEDPQSKLFFDFLRILNWIKENNNENVKFLLENVEMKKEWRDSITEFMGVEPISINSKLLSAQNRPRVYWTNIDRVEVPNNKNIKLIDILDDIDFEHETIDGLKICNSISENSKKLIHKVDGEVRISQSTKLGYIVAENGDGVNLSFPLSKSRRGRVIKQKTNCLDTSCNICVYYNDSIRRLSISELEKLQTLPIGYTMANVSDRAKIKAIGNGWTVDVIAHILKGLR